MVNEAAKEPIVEEVIEVGDVVNVVPSYWTVMVDEAAKPVPETVTVVLTLPLDELSAIEESILKVDDAEFDDESIVKTL